MADFAWPADIVPYRVMFYLQPHIGGQESPLTRTRKVYGLSAPRWIARLTFRGGVDGVPRVGDQAGYGPRLDALIAQLQGGLNRIAFHDFRRPVPARPQQVRTGLTIAAAAIGDASIKISGFAPNTVAYSFGDYVGGDGRPHLVTGGGIVSGAAAVMADGNGSAVVSIEPPIWAPIAAGTPVAAPAKAWFRLTSEDAGQNEVAIGDAVEMTFDFVEDLP